MALVDSDRVDVARRFRAAVALSGFPSVEALADELAHRNAGVGLKRLREISQQRGNPARAVELREIAEACGVPYGIFTLDLQAALDNGRPDTDERVNRLEQAVILLVRQMAREQPELQREFLEALRTRTPSRPAQAGGEAESAGEA